MLKKHKLVMLSLIQYMYMSLNHVLSNKMYLYCVFVGGDCGVGNDYMRCGSLVGLIFICVVCV